jgi:hypothetical protein
MTLAGDRPFFMGNAASRSRNRYEVYEDGGVDGAEHERE